MYKTGTSHDMGWLQVSKGWKKTYPVNTTYSWSAGHQDSRTCAHTEQQLQNTQADLGDIAGSVPDHRNKASANFFGFQCT